MADLPLRGIRILDLTRLLPGPFCTLLLADLGADVVKVEDPDGGDYLRDVPPFVGDTGAQFCALNRGKRSLVLDLKRPEGVDAFLRLCEHFDAVVESFRPGTMERLGLGSETLRQRNPALVVTSVSGYGQDGPFARRAGHDLTYEALGGVLGVWREPGGPPRPPGIQVADLAGGIFAALGTVAALLARERGHPIPAVDVSLAESALALLIPDLGAFFAAGEEPRQGSGLLRGGAASYDVYETRDGQWLAVAALEPKFWEQLEAALGRPVERRGMDDAQAREALRALFREKTRREWEEILSGHDACAEPVLSLRDLAEHPQHVARRVFFTIEDPRRGRLRQVRTPLGTAGGQAPPPARGEHTAEVLGEAGFSPEEIAALTAAGVVRAGR